MKQHDSNEAGIKENNIWKFIIPSLIGIILFLIPVQYQGQSLLVVGIFVNFLTSSLGRMLPLLMVLLIVIPTAISLWNSYFPIGYIERRPTLQHIFTSTRFWLAVKTLGAFFAVITYLKLGPEFIHSAKTGGNILFSLLPVCGVWFFASGLFLPLLTDYGIMDFMGTILKCFARPLFLVPGRALIDCFSSWIGSGVCGTVLTTNQYATGYYTAREAAIIITNFSVVGISFCSAIAQYLEISYMFSPFYLAVITGGFVCALITPRIWPLRSIANLYNPECGKVISETTPPDTSNIRWGIGLAVGKASCAPSLRGFFIKGFTMAFDIIANTAPILMAFGTAALILTEYTPLFIIISYPFKLLLEVFHVPYAAEAAPAMLLGFADQYLPVIIGATIPSLYTRFIIGCISILQVIYMTEIGAIILTSKVPLKLWHLLVIFLERTLISLPIVIIFANIYAK